MLERFINFSRLVNEERVGLPEFTSPEMWIPNESIRGHHWDEPEVLDAFMQRGDPIESAKQLHIAMRLQSFWGENFNDPYWEDVVGSGYGDEKNFGEELGKYLARLYALSDTDVIQFDEEPDGMCKSCVVGRHCTAVNYSSNINGSTTDKRAVDGIRRSLQAYRYGIDYVVLPQTSIVYDYEDRSLIAMHQGEERSFEHNAVRAKVGAIREIVRQTELDVLNASVMAYLPQTYY